MPVDSAPEPAQLRGAQPRDTLKPVQPAQPAQPQQVKYPPLPECTRGEGEAKAKSWIMVFMGHSGSTAIVSELMQNSDVHFELPEPVDHGENAENGTLAYEYVRSFFQRGIAAGKTPGFKMRPKHILDPAMRQKWRDLVKEYDTHIIWQYRENIFKQAVGEYTHRYLNDTSVVEGIDGKLSAEERCKIGAGCRFRVENYDFFHGLLRDAMNNDRLIAKAVNSITSGSDKCTLALPYESYLYDREGVMRRLFNFLGIRQEMHAPTRAKATKDSMCSAVANYGDLCREFYGCHNWRSMMDDLRNDCYCAKYMSGPGTTGRCGIEMGPR